MSERPPVADWATDFDHLTDEWAAQSPEITKDLRQRCPVAHTDRFYGAYLVTRYDDITDAARQTEVFSNRITLINDNHPDNVKLELPPITLDPPDHGPVRRAMLPWFNPREMGALEPLIEGMAAKLIDSLGDPQQLVDDGTPVDAALDYAQLLPVDVMLHLFGVDEEMGPKFRQWVDGILKDGLTDLELARTANREVQAYFRQQLTLRSQAPAASEPPDLITRILQAETEDDDGTRRPFSERERIGGLFVLLLGGIDTTWSSMGASLYHLATHPEHREALVADPSLLPGAIEEFLRFYAPVTIARISTDDAEIAGCPVDAGHRLLFSYPSANRDPDHFDNPDEVILDRSNNRHLAFGVGVHRCLGSNLARLELLVGLRSWLAAFPNFELAVEPEEIRWSHGVVRGPKHVPIRILETAA